MALGNGNYTNGNKRSNYSFQMKVLRLLQRIINAL
jgi:hypothetical protein